MNTFYVFKGVDSEDYWGDIKEDWGSGGRSSPEAEVFFVKLHIIFALQYNKQQLLLLLAKNKPSLNDTTSKILGGGHYHGRPLS